jgi:hypothetical protein
MNFKQLFCKHNWANKGWNPIIINGHAYHTVYKQCDKCGKLKIKSEEFGNDKK